MPKTIRTPKSFPLLSPGDIARFWSHVNVRGPDECWPWTAAIKKQNGYGCFVTKEGLYLAHRIAYRIHHQDDPGVLLVCHHCDNPPCCNGAHLFKGTDKDNSDDRIAKGRSGIRPCGESHGRVKLTENDVLEIRKLWNKELRNSKSLSKQFGVTQSTIRAAASRKSWKCLA